MFFLSLALTEKTESGTSTWVIHLVAAIAVIAVIIIVVVCIRSKYLIQNMY